MIGTYQPKVSIITVCLNSEKFLEETIRSVREQTYKNIEYIVIDGGSTDGTLDKIKKYADKIDYWVSEPDKGISDAFNKGIRISKGDVIGIINAGDRYTDDAIAVAVKALIDNPDYDFVFGDLIYTDIQWKPQFLMKGDRNYKKKIHYTMPAINHPSVFVKKDVYETCGFFDISYKVAMDYEFFLRITYSGRKGIYIEKPFALMALGGTSYSRFYNSYKEVCRASIKYGYNPLMAYIRLYLKGLRGLIRMIFEIFRLHSIIAVIRKVFWNIKVLSIH